MMAVFPALVGPMKETFILSVMGWVLISPLVSLWMSSKPPKFWIGGAVLSF